MGRQVQRLTQELLVLRSLRFPAAERLVRAARFGTEIKVQSRVAGLEPPPIGDAIVCCQLRPVGSSCLPVGEHNRQRRGRVHLLQATNMVVIVIEGRDCQGQSLVGLTPVADLIGHQGFGHKIWPADQKKRRLPRSKELPVDPRWRSDGARDGPPQQLAARQGPSQATAGLQLDTGVIVVFDLCAEGQTQPIAPHRHLILHEAVEPAPGDLGRQEGQCGAVADIVVAHAVAKAPDDVMPAGRMKTVLEFGIVGVEDLCERGRHIAMGPVVVHLQREIGVFGKRMRPAGEHIPAARGNMVRAKLRDPAIVDVALH